MTTIKELGYYPTVSQRRNNLISSSIEFVPTSGSWRAKATIIVGEEIQVLKNTRHETATNAAYALKHNIRNAVRDLKAKQAGTL